MKVLLITGCDDCMRWYSGLVGETVPFIRDEGTEYRSRDLSGYINFVQYKDAIITDQSSTKEDDLRKED